jgi:hypothetical protein
VSRRRGLIAGGLVVVALVAILLLSNPTQDRYSLPSFSPRGTGPDGAAALVELLRQEGADVRVGGLPAAGDDIVLAFQETLSGEAADDLRRWVDDGGTLVVADPGAALAPPSIDDAFTARSVPAPGDCSLQALDDVSALDPGLPAVYVAPDEANRCFVDPTSDEQAAGLVVTARGAGLVVALGSPLLLVNERLDQADNAVLAAALLAPSEGVDVRVLDPNRFIGDDGEAGDGTILGALPRRGSQAVTQLVIAFLAWGLIRARRLGRPVAEELPVPLPASDLVLASGHLLDRNGDVADAAERLRRRARRDLGLALGLGADPPPTELAAALQARAGAEAGLVHAALLAPVLDESGLVVTSTHLDRLRRELTP